LTVAGPGLGMEPLTPQNFNFIALVILDDLQKNFGLVDFA
jgi:hypothetical protein